jgi:hypothetical protein
MTSCVTAMREAARGAQGRSVMASASGAILLRDRDCLGDAVTVDESRRDPRVREPSRWNRSWG